MSPQTKQGGILGARFLFALGIIIFLILIVGYFFYALQPTLGPDSEKIDFKITKGESFRSIGAHLSQTSLIKSIAVFKFYSLLVGKAQNFQPGIHELDYGMSVPAIVSELARPGKNEATVTVPEGSTMRDITEILTRAGVFRESESFDGLSVQDYTEDYSFLSEVFSFEGFLFPDTYRLEVDSSSDRVVRKFLDNFERKGWNKILHRKNWYDLLILASFLEREVPNFEDRQIVAGILLKRIEAGMPFQIDATLSYIKCEGKFLGCENIRVLRKDLELFSPFNTYKRVGWTPTPISNPGEDALEAVLNPVRTSYWYYLSAKETGETIFSRTLDEHNTNRVKYL